MDSAGGKVIQSFGVLVNSLSNHTKDLQHLMKWRSGCTDGSYNSVRKSTAKIIANTSANCNFGVVILLSH